MSAHPARIGYRVLASGNIAVVQPNGDVSAIVKARDWHAEPDRRSGR